MRCAEKVHVLAQGDKRFEFYYYTAHIPVAFLDKFDMPSRFLPSAPILMTYYRIPLSVKAGLAEALEAIICEVNNSTPCSEFCRMVSLERGWFARPL